MVNLKRCYLSIATLSAYIFIPFKNMNSKFSPFSFPSIIRFLSTFPIWMVLSPVNLTSPNTIAFTRTGSSCVCSPNTHIKRFITYLTTKFNSFCERNIITCIIRRSACFIRTWLRAKSLFNFVSFKRFFTLFADFAYHQNNYNRIELNCQVN